MGTILAWGSNDDRRIVDKPAGVNFVALASRGSMHMAGIRSDGTLAVWGRDEFGQRSGAPVGVFAAVDCGWGHSLALATSGHIFAWGRGIGTPPAGGGHLAVCAGDSWSAALDADGQVVAFGLSAPWDSGHDTPDSDWRGYKLPGEPRRWLVNGVRHGSYPLPEGGGFVALAGGGWGGGYAIHADGTAVPFGYMAEAMATPPAGPFAEVAIGPGYVLGRRPAGELVAWGADVTTNEWRADPLEVGGKKLVSTPAGILAGVPAGSGYRAVAAGRFAAFALNASGQVVYWGNNTDTERTNVPGGPGFTRLAAGCGAAYAL